MVIPKDSFRKFFEEHHVLTLATSVDNNPWCANCFYAYLPDEVALVFTSDADTRHIREALKNPRVAGSVVLETETVGKIQGLQFTGILAEPVEKDTRDKIRKRYLKRFPYAAVMKTTLWLLQLNSLKLTDNRLGFGKKMYWDRTGA